MEPRGWAERVLNGSLPLRPSAPQEEGQICPPLVACGAGVEAKALVGVQPGFLQGAAPCALRLQPTLAGTAGARGSAEPSGGRGWGGGGAVSGVLSLCRLIGFCPSIRDAPKCLLCTFSQEGSSANTSCAQRIRAALPSWAASQLCTGTGALQAARRGWSLFQAQGTKGAAPLHSSCRAQTPKSAQCGLPHQEPLLPLDTTERASQAGSCSERQAGSLALPSPSPSPAPGLTLGSHCSAGSLAAVFPAGSIAGGYGFPTSCRCR